MATTERMPTTTPERRLRLNAFTMNVVSHIVQGQWTRDHAEATFIVAQNVQGAKTNVADLRARAARHGRDPRDILVFQGLTVITDSSEEAARRKHQEVLDQLSEEGTLDVVSGWLGADLGAFDPDEPIGNLQTNATQGLVKALIEGAPDKTWRFGDLVKTIAHRFIVGAGEQVADELQTWYHEGDIDGINLTYTTTPGSFVDFVDGVVPVLQRRGLVQTEYAPGTLREKLTGGGPRINDRHPAASFRRQAPEVLSA